MAEWEYKDISKEPGDKRSYWRERILSLVQREDPDGHFSANFTEYMDFDFSLFQAFIVILSRGELEGFSSVRRMPFWPKTAVRIYNRHYLSLKVRKMFQTGGLEGSLGYKKGASKPYSQITAPLYKKMLAAAKESGAKIALVTRPDKGPSQAIRAIHLKMRLNDPGWRLSPDYVLTCPCRERPECWQRYVFLPLGAGNQQSERGASLPTITASEYRRRFAPKTAPAAAEPQSSP